MLPRLYRSLMNDFYNDLNVNGWLSYPIGLYDADVSIKTHLIEGKEFYTLEISIPGVNKDEIKAEYKDGILSVTLPKKKKTKSESKQIDIK